MAVPDRRTHFRRHLGVANSGVRRPARALDDAGRSEDFRGGAVLGGVFVRALRSESDRLARTARRLALGGGLRHRALEFRAGQLLLHPESQVLRVASRAGWLRGAAPSTT